MIRPSMRFKSRVNGYGQKIQKIRDLLAKKCIGATELQTRQKKALKHEHDRNESSKEEKGLKNEHKPHDPKLKAAVKESAADLTQKNLKHEKDSNESSKEESILQEQFKELLEKGLAHEEKHEATHDPKMIAAAKESAERGKEYFELLKKASTESNLDKWTGRLAGLVQFCLHSWTTFPEPLSCATNTVGIFASLHPSMNLDNRNNIGQEVCHPISCQC